MKFKVIRAIIVAFVLMAAGVVYGKTNTVIINGTSIQLETIEKDGRVFYPLRAICNELGIKIVEVTDKDIRLARGEYIVLMLRQDLIVSNEQGFFIGPSAPIEKNNVTYIPIRTLGYMFGYDLSFKGKQLMITAQKDFVPPVGTNPSDEEMKEMREMELCMQLNKEINAIDEKGMSIAQEVKKTGKINKLPDLIKEIEAYVQEIDGILEGVENDIAKDYMRSAQDYLNACKNIYICTYNRDSNKLEQVIDEGEKAVDNYVEMYDVMNKRAKEVIKFVYIQ